MNILKNLFFDGANNIQPSIEILENKENFNIDLIYNSIYSALDILSKEKKIIIVFEDIQWADQLSIKLLINLILHIHSNVLFILTKTNSIDVVTDRLFLTLKDLSKILLIDLKPFSKRDIALIIKKNFSQKKREERNSSLLLLIRCRKRRSSMRKPRHARPFPLCPGRQAACLFQRLIGLFYRRYSCFQILRKYRHHHPP